MKAFEFIKYLTLKEKVFYIIGKILNKISLKEYEDLKSTQELLNFSKSLNYQIDQDKHFYFASKNGQSIHLRKKSSDIDVFRQIIIDQEYKSLISFVINNDITIKHIIDVGSNIGLTSLVLLSEFSNSSIICLEPDTQNFEILKVNLSHYAINQNCFLLNKALWSSEKTLFLSKNFRDGKEWSRRVQSIDSDVSSSGIQGVTINTLIKEFNLEEISILKIDIEGAEGEVFRNDNDLNFLNIVKVIALEIHDELVDRKLIYEILKKYNFILFNSGEITIGINKKLLI